MVIGLAGTVLLVPILSLLFWAILPQALLPGSVFPEGRLPIASFFLHAILACSMLGSVLAWWVIRQSSA